MFVGLMVDGDDVGQLSVFSFLVQPISCLDLFGYCFLLFQDTPTIGMHGV